MENSRKYVKTNMGLMPYEDYMDIESQKYGFDSYEELREAGMTLEEPEVVTVEEKCNWLIGAGGSEMDGVSMERVFGTESQVRQYLFSMVQDNRESNPDCWEYGTESEDEIQTQYDGSLYAYGCYSDYHVDYAARKETDPISLDN